MSSLASTTLISGCSPSSIQKLSKLRVYTYEGLFKEVRKHFRTPLVPTLCPSAYAADVEVFLRRLYIIDLDMAAKVEEGLLTRQGVAPFDWFEVVPLHARAAHPYSTMPASRPAASPPYVVAGPPPWLCCPLTGEFFEDPVFTVNGNTYSRQAIEAHFRQSRSDPLTGEPIGSPWLVADEIMKHMLDVYKRPETMGYDL